MRSIARNLSHSFRFFRTAVQMWTGNAISPKRTELPAVITGVGLFVDDYSSVLILGFSFMNLNNRFFVSREKLAFVTDSTSAPIASTSPISSWIAFELNKIRPEFIDIQIFCNLETKRMNFQGSTACSLTRYLQDIIQFSCLSCKSPLS